MTHPAFSDLPASASRAEPQAVRTQSISRRAAEFLIELSISLQKRAMYPPGHPHLRSSADRLTKRAGALLEAEPEVVFGIGREQIVVDGVSTDARNTLYRELSERLHRHRVAALRMSRGVTVGDLDLLVGLLGSDPSRSSRPGGLFAESASLQHVRLQPIEYERIVLDDTGPDAESTPQPARHAEDLWTDLARLAAESSPGSLSAMGAEPMVLARSIDCGSAESGYDREMLGRLTHLSEALAERNDPRDEALQARISKLLIALRPGTLVRLLAAGEDDEERRRFIRAASDALDVEAVMKVLEAVAAAANQQVSHHLFRLLRKMGKIDSGAPAGTRAAVDTALRQSVNRLLEGIHRAGARRHAIRSLCSRP